MLKVVHELTPQHKQWLAERAHLIALDLQKGASHARWLDADLDSILWYWAVDGVHAGKVKRDAFAPKNAKRGGLDRVSHTMAARTAFFEGKKVTREHVVPKRVLRKLIGSASASEVSLILQRFCFVVYVTKAEHEQLPRQAMPDAWDASGLVLERDPWARYRVPELEATVQVVGNVPGIRTR